MLQNLVRPTTIEELHECQKRFVTQESIRRALAFKPQPTDVLISPYSKCGTTWVQQIVHGLRTRGSMAFDEITAVVPWLELAHDMRVDLEMPQVGMPSVFKSHFSWDLIPKGGRYIYVIRDPKDAVVSAYYFMEGWFFESGSISLADFTRAQYINAGRSHGYWPHVASWWPHRNDSDVLFLCYEDMKEDLEGTVQRIAAFIECPLDAELLDIVVHQSSVGFMRAHKHQFDDHLLRQTRDAGCGLPPGGDSSKVRTGNVGDHNKELPQDISEALDAVWREEITPALGFPSYAVLRAAVG